MNPMIQSSQNSVWPSPRTLLRSYVRDGQSCIPKAWGCQEDISTLLKGDIITLLPHAASEHHANSDIKLNLRLNFVSAGSA